jgi:AAA domain
VVIEGDPENWKAEFPALADLQFDPPEVIAEDLFIRGNIHVVAGRFEAYKTMGLIEASDAILSERPVFDHFKVQHRYPIMFLCADMSPELFSDYATPFNLRKHGEDFRVMNPKGNVMHAIDSPVLQRAVKGRILILDTMLDFAKIKEAFQSGEWITFMQKLRELITLHGCVAVIMTAHATKTGAKSNTIDPSEYLKDSVTFGGKIDVGLAFSRLENTSQIFVERIKSRGFKKPLSFTITVNDENGHCNFDRGRFPVYLKPGEAGKKEDHVPVVGRKPNPKRDEQTQLILQLRSEGKTFNEIATAVGIPESTARAYYHANEWDKNKGDQ